MWMWVVVDDGVRGGANEREIGTEFHFYRGRLESARATRTTRVRETRRGAPATLLAVVCVCSRRRKRRGPEKKNLQPLSVNHTVRIF